MTSGLATSEVIVVLQAELNPSALSRSCAERASHESDTDTAVLLYQAITLPLKLRYIWSCHMTALGVLYQLRHNSRQHGTPHVLVPRSVSWYRNLSCSWWEALLLVLQNSEGNPSLLEETSQARLRFTLLAKKRLSHPPRHLTNSPWTRV